MGIQNTFKALSDPTRRAILEFLKGGSRTAGEIAAQFDMTAATVSHHLAVLRGADLVTDTRAGKYIYYELSASVMDELIGYITALWGGGSDHADE